MISGANKLLRLSALGLLGAALIAIPASSQDPQQQPAPDNSKTNKQERGSATADKQKMNPADRETARKIRSAIHDDKTLSTYAHNVKVIVQNGQVTLKGPVRSEEEKTTVESKATAVAGAGNVTNNLTVAPKSKS
jgi:hyperosmotically inducible periplasmic protein